MNFLNKKFIKEHIADSEVIFKRGENIFHLGNLYLKNSNSEKNIFNYPILYQILQDEDSAWRSANKRTEANVDQKNKEISVEKWYRSAYDVIEIVLKEINEKIPALGSIELISKNQLDKKALIITLCRKLFRIFFTIITKY